MNTLPDGWHHPDDAPRDGTRIIGYGRAKTYHYWREAMWHGSRHTDPLVIQTYYSANSWQVGGGTMDLLAWQEMPAAPEGVDAGEIKEVMSDRGPVDTRYSRLPTIKSSGGDHG